MYHKKKLFLNVENVWNIKFLVDVKAKYFSLETKMQGVETEWRRLRDIARSAATFSLDLEFNLRIRRLRRSFRGAHVGPSSPSSLFFMLTLDFTKLCFHHCHYRYCYNFEFLMDIYHYRFDINMVIVFVLSLFEPLLLL